jgi:hypothetical protein
MKTQLKEITPEWAADILSRRNPNNRNLSTEFVSKLARDIKMGAFLVTHQGIAFDEKGDLLDGQHRLAAIVQAGIAVKMLVTSDLPIGFRLNGVALKTFEVIDAGKPRSVGQMLAIKGCKNANKTAAVVRAMANWVAGRESWISLSTAQTSKILYLVGPDVEWAVKRSLNSLSQPQAAILAPIAFFHSVSDGKAEEFGDKFFTLADCGKDHPAMALAGWCKRRRGLRWERTHGCRVTCSAIWHFLCGRSITQLHDNQEASDRILSMHVAVADAIRKVINE